MNFDNKFIKKCLWYDDNYNTSKFEDTSPVKKKSVILLAGNPNVGKSTIFNSMTGLRQHTGNWAGKTVSCMNGEYKYKDKKFILADIPGTYSLMSNSSEEELACNFICFGEFDVTVVVADAVCLERNLNLVYQILEVTENVVVCVNLMDQAMKMGINIDIKALSKKLGIPVVGTCARTGNGLEELKEEIYKIVSSTRTVEHVKRVIYDEAIEYAIEQVELVMHDFLNLGTKLWSRWVALKLLDGDVSIIKFLEKYLNVKILGNYWFDVNVNDIRNNMLNRLATKRTNLKSIVEIEMEDNLDKGVKVSEISNAHNIPKQYVGLDILDEVFKDSIVHSIVYQAKNLCKDVEVSCNRNTKIDTLLTSRIFGLPIMILLLSVIFWITIVGANYPSQVLSWILCNAEVKLSSLIINLGVPIVIHDVAIKGIFRTLGWVVSVMLPPMAIFFPIFTFLEDLGYLPRIVFNLDSYFKKACTHGKQVLTMCMGFGCNAAGVVGARIIDSPRERLIAIITNTFVPCNGRFPTLIAMSLILSSLIMGSSGIYEKSISVLIVTGVVVLGVFITLIISRLLSKTFLKGVPSFFILELPPYRKPNLWHILVRSTLDRTIFVLMRAVYVTIPAGLLIWLMANIKIGMGNSILAIAVNFLQPFAQLIGLDGHILVAFILGFPANEIVLPIIVMSYTAAGSLTTLGSLDELKNLFLQNGWTWLTCLCVILFCLLHYPCGTTLWTIKKETKSKKWTLMSFAIPTIVGVTVCFIVTQLVRN